LETAFSIADAAQDICLGLKYERKTPLFLPRQLLGIGKVPGSWNTTTWINAINNTRSEYIRDLTITVLHEAMGWKDNEILKLKGNVTVNQKHFNGEATVKLTRIPAADPIRAYTILEEDQWDLFPEGVIEKLIAAKRLVPESQVGAYYLFQERLQTLEQKIESEDLFEVIRSENLELVQATPEEVARTVPAFSRKFKQVPWLLTTKRKEALYPANIIDVLNQCDPLRVDIDLEYLKRFGRPPRADTPYQRNVNKLEDWFYNNRENILQHELYDLPPTEIIQDDPVMVEAAKRSQSPMVIFVTNDR